MSDSGGKLVYRHRLFTRTWHWFNVVVLLVMLMSGLMIFNAHPRLYWGSYGANMDHPWLEIGDKGDRGYLRVGALTLTTTGVLGVSNGESGLSRGVAFPYWSTIPSSYSLAGGRRWHLTFAWLFSFGILSYLIWMVISGHLRQDLLPKSGELKPANLLADIKRHVTFRLPKGAAALNYNTLQKLAYLAVLLVLIPLMVLTGLTMSPQMDATWSWLLDIFGGRQSARSIHFIAAWLLVGFIVVHLIMVLVAGPYNEIRSMITGRFRLPDDQPRKK